MRRLPLYFLLFTFSFLLSAPLAFAVTNPLTLDENTISATIPDSTVSVPHLHSPSNGSYTNNPFEPFSWQRSTSDTGIDHYTFYRDGVIVADNITHADSQNTSIFSASVDSSYVYLTFKTALPEGTHTWRVIATGSEGNTTSSETWTFTVDTTIPDIIVNSVDKNKMYWATHDPRTIPPFEKRHLTSTTANPLISGKVEANSNIKFSLVCPISATACTSQTITLLETDGNWEHRFRGLIKNVTYSVFISATDAAGNSNSFPEFTITYRPGGLPPLPTPTPPLMPSIPPSISPSVDILTPTTYLPPTVSPGDFFRQPPAPPSPPAPPIPFPTVSIKAIPFVSSPTSYWLVLFGLLAHLSMAFYGAGIRFKHLPGFLYTLCFPFLGKKSYQIEPFFATVIIFDPANLSHEFFSWVSNIKGRINLDFPSPKQVFIQLTRPGYEKQALLLATTALSEGTALKLKPKDHPGTLERTKTFCLSIRGLPLIAADLTSILILILAPSLPVAFYFGLAATLTFSEYIYPRLK